MTNNEMSFLNKLASMTEEQAKFLLGETSQSPDCEEENDDYKAALEQAHDMTINWMGDIDEACALLCAAQRYTESGNTIPEQKAYELDAIITVVSRALVELSEDMGFRANKIVDLLNIEAI